jgi:protein involved in polysaccharide export with SLBB domain
VKRNYNTFLFMVSGTMIVPLMAFSSKKNEFIKPSQTISLTIQVNKVNNLKPLSASDEYQVDASGNIMLPLIGVLKIAGLRKEEASQLIYKRACQYFEQPSVLLTLKR